MVYLLRRTTDVDYEEDYAMVVVAESEEAARLIAAISGDQSYNPNIAALWLDAATCRITVVSTTTKGVVLIARKG